MKLMIVMVMTAAVAMVVPSTQALVCRVVATAGVPVWGTMPALMCSSVIP
jgi:hypothetical protein